MSHASVLVALDPTDDIEAAITWQMAPFDENAAHLGDDAGWFVEGSRWDWWQIGGRFSGRLSDNDVMRRGDVDLTAQCERNRARLAGCYASALRESNEKLWQLCYDVQPGESEEAYIARKLTAFPSFHAFLRNRVWHERARMGWFGATAKTECQLQGKDVRICVHENKALGSRIVSWGDSNSWAAMYWPRFVEPLPADTLLVLVDYHV